MSAAPVTSPTAVQSRPSALEVFQARCEARVHLYASGDIPDLHEAVDALQEHAARYGLIRQIGQDAAQRIIAEAFRLARAGEGPS
jgi:hypothetical protein